MTITGMFRACIDHRVSSGVSPDTRAYTEAPYATRKLKAIIALPLLYHKTSIATIDVWIARKQASPQALNNKK
jgi:hypothetical protein